MTLGTLFPHDRDGNPDEYPDHKGVPAGHEHFSKKHLGAVVVAGLVGITVRDLCPRVVTQPDPPQREHAPGPGRLTTAAVGSTSGVPLDWGNNSLDAANEIIRANNTRRAHYNVSFSSSGLVGSPLYQST